MRAEEGVAPRHGRSAGARHREEAVVARLQQLTTALDDEPAPDFRAATRARLVAMAAVRSPEPERPGVLRRLAGARATDGPPPRWRTRVTAGLAGAALAVSALGTLVALSADAKPGDLLYDLKRGTERTQLALAGDDRALTLLQFASTRLDELATARDDAELVVETLATMDAQTTEGVALLVDSALEAGTPAPVDLLADWSEEQAAELARLQPELPATATGAAQASLDLLEAVQARVAAAQAALGCPTPPPSEGSDDLGPIPGTCRGSAPVVPPEGGSTPPAGPGTATAGPSAPPADPTVAPEVGGGTAAPGGGPASGSGGAGPAAPGGSSPSTGAGPTLPTLPLPLPGTGSGGQPLPSLPSAGTTAHSTAPLPPLIDTPLPVCVYPVIC